MRAIFIVIATILISLHVQAQNKNVKDETKTTTTTITDSKGNRKYVKKENTREVQEIELKNEKPNTLNIETKDSPINVVTTTNITNPDGTTRTVDIDRTSIYTLNDKKYRVSMDAKGYQIITDDSIQSALLRKTSTNIFIYRNDEKSAIGYFDINGNLVLETYDPKTDSVSYKTYIADKK